VAVLVPELASSAAVREWYNARRHTRLCQESGLAGWTTAHCFLAEMGGIRLVNDNCRWTGGEGRCPREVQTNIGQISRLHKNGLLSREVVNLSAEDIADRSKADGLVKAIAIVQTLWFAAQCIGRAAQGLHLTALEIVTPGFVLCALVNYTMWYYKPLDVSHGVVASYSCTLPDGSHAPALNMGNTRDGFLADPDPLRPGGMALLVLLVVFGAVHCAAWNADFPTPSEGLLWRIAAAMTTGIPLLLFTFLHFEGRTPAGSKRTTIFDLVIYGTMVSYVLARGCLVVEMFASLRAQPLECYQSVEWIKFLPHFG